MDMKNVTQSSDENQTKIAKYEMITRLIGPLIIVFLGFFTLILILARQQLAETAPWLLYFFEFCLAMLVLGCIIGFFKMRYDKHNAEIARYKHNTYRFQPSGEGNYEAYFNGQTFVQALPGNILQPAPHTYSPHITYKNDKSTVIEEEKQPEAIGMSPSAIQIPTFAESMRDGLIGPRQSSMLFCHELLADENTGRYTAISPIQGEIGLMHTQFVAGGSQSGKSTYMAAMIAQACAMDTLLYVIDPHKNVPEKSLTAKIAAFSDYFILPSAGTHQEIARLLEHATKTRDALLQGKATKYRGYHIIVVVDEVPALMAYQRSTDKAIRQLYINLALFMQSIGTQTAKVGMTGLFGSQFITKDEIGEIDFRDSCMSQLLLRLPKVQARAMGILGKQEVDSIPKLEKGHGYLLLSDEYEPRRVASGNATSADLTQLARLLPPSPLSNSGPIAVQNRFVSGSIAVQNSDQNEPQLDDNSGSIVVQKVVEIPVHPALEAKVTQVLEMLGENKADIMKTVWGIAPTKSPAYDAALEEYSQVMRIIARMARKEA